MNNGGRNWTDERIALLKDLNLRGLSFSEIGRRCTMLPPHTEVSRNSAIGKAYRLGLPRHNRPIIRKARRRKLSRHSPPKGPPQMTRIAKLLANLPTEPLPPAAETDIARVSFKELNECHCKWPVGEPHVAGTDAPMFCGAERFEGLPYCKDHARRAFSTPVVKTPARVPVKQEEFA